MTDNGSAYISTVHAIACRTLGIRHLRTRPRRPQTNGKAERFIRTMLGGWAYGAIYRSSAERTAALEGWLWRYNFRRPHGARPKTARSSARRAEQPARVLQLGGVAPASGCSREDVVQLVAFQQFVDLGLLEGLPEDVLGF